MGDQGRVGRRNILHDNQLDRQNDFVEAKCRLHIGSMANPRLEDQARHSPRRISQNEGLWNGARDHVRFAGMVALGRVVFTSREHVIALEPRGKGLLGITLRYPYEVRKEGEYFEEIPDEKIPKDMLELASHIV